MSVEQNNIKNNLITIYPNPVDEALNIETTNNLIIDKIIITDLSGKKVRRKKGNDKQINVQKPQKGVYIIQMFSEEKSSSMKFLKQ